MTFLTVVIPYHPSSTTAISKSLAISLPLRLTATAFIERTGAPPLQHDLNRYKAHYQENLGRNCLQQIRNRGTEASTYRFTRITVLTRYYQDPYFEHVPATRLDGTPTGKIKKRKKALPPGITDHDAKVLTKVKRRAYRLDLCLFSCFGVRFGWGSVIGIVPA